MEKRNLDVFEKIVQTAEKIKEAQEKKINGSNEPKDKYLGVSNHDSF